VFVTEDPVGRCHSRSMTQLSFFSRFVAARRGWLLLALLSVAGAACEAQPGERCDGFFTNTCAYPGMCVELEDRSVCAVSCDRRFGGEDPGPYCADPAHEMVEVTAELGSTSGAMGCYCVPRS
jgi:hypothetical protein